MRSKWKGPFIEKALLHKTIKKNGSLDIIKIYSRASTITLPFVGRTVNVYNGKNMVPLIITEDMLGYKFGDFILTKKRHIFGKLMEMKK